MNYPWQATVQDDAGNAVVNPVVTVWEADGVTLATIYDVTGAEIANPVMGSLEGFVQFWATDGEYRIEGVSGGQETEVWSWVAGVDLSAIEADISAIEVDVAYIGTSDLGVAGAVPRAARAKANDWVSIRDFGATGEWSQDSTFAWEAAEEWLTSGGTSPAKCGLFIPEGWYKTNHTFTADDINLFGTSSQGAVIAGTSADPTKPLLSIGGQSNIHDLHLTFYGNNANAGVEGNRVALKTGGHLYPLCRGASVKDLRITAVGTGIWSPKVDSDPLSEAFTAFNTSFDNIQIVDPECYGLRFTAPNSSGVYIGNIYIQGGASDRPNGGKLDCVGGLSINPDYAVSDLKLGFISIEGLNAWNPCELVNIRALDIGVLRFENVSMRGNGGEFVLVDKSSGRIQSLSLVYCSVGGANACIVKIRDGYAHAPATSIYRNTVNRLAIGNFHVLQLWADREKTLPLTSTTNFRWYDRDRTPAAGGPYYMDVEQWNWYNFQDADNSIYENFGGDPNGYIQFERKGQQPVSGNNDDRPTNRLIAGRTQYWNTERGKLELWTGSTWIDLN